MAFILETMGFVGDVSVKTTRVKEPSLAKMASGHRNLNFATSPEFTLRDVRRGIARMMERWRFVADN